MNAMDEEASNIGIDTEYVILLMKIYLRIMLWLKKVLRLKNTIIILN